jgi:uroporphyrinogen-III synthase
MLYTRKILICRPLEQAKSLDVYLQAHGYFPLIFPTLDIQAINYVLPEIWLQHADLILVQSPSSIKYLAPSNIALLQQNQKIYAMGAGTQEALLKSRISSKWVASAGSDSEAIISHIETILAPNSQVLILTGEGGRSVLEPELVNKGFICHRVNTYKRAVPVYTAQEIKIMIDEKPELIIITSVDMLKNLLSIFSEYKNYQTIIKLPILVISNRIKQAARGLGWQGEIFVAASAMQEDILQRILKFSD